MDHPNTGFLPVLIGIGEWFSIFDVSWVVCYTDHRLRTSAPRIDFEAHFSEDGILQGSPSASLLWLEMSCLDAIYGIGNLLQLFCDTIRARMSHQEASQSGVVHDGADNLSGNGHSDDNAIPMETWATGGPVDMTNTPTEDGPVSNSFNRVWNKTGLWLRGWLALARVATVLEWKYMFKFAPASSQENLEAGGVQGSIPERLPDIQYPRVHHLFSDDQEEQNRLNNLMRTSDRLLLVYGPYIMEIHNSKKAQVPPLQDLKFKATARLVFLLTLSIFGLMTKSRTWACGFLILLVPLLLHSRIEKQSEAQREFFNKVSECSREIERTSRYLHGKYVEPQHTYWAQRPFDVLLRYNGVIAWCRYSPVPPGEENERQSGNTWIELVIPSTSSKCNRLYKFIDCAAHSFLPWGHCDNWDVNIVYASLTFLFSCYAVWLGVVGLAFAWALKLFSPFSKWGKGDQWTLAWYVFIIQWLTNGDLSRTLVFTVTSIISLAKTMVFPTAILGPANTMQPASPTTAAANVILTTVSACSASTSPY